jgi:hypothetical protein
MNINDNSKLNKEANQSNLIPILKIEENYFDRQMISPTNAPLASASEIKNQSRSNHGNQKALL